MSNTAAFTAAGAVGMIGIIGGLALRIALERRPRYNLPREVEEVARLQGLDVDAYGAAWLSFPRNRRRRIERACERSVREIDGYLDVGGEAIGAIAFPLEARPITGEKRRP